MPTYEYRCETCQHQFEIFASMSDPDPETCPDCGGGPLRKVLHPVAVHYKGSGFYSTDYKGKKPAAASGSSAESSASSGAGSESSSTGGGDSSSSSSSSSSAGDGGSSASSSSPASSD